MSVAAAAELLARARALDAEAMAGDEEAERERALRAQAAALRREALGERPYPVLVCVGCFLLTGWRDSDGRCDACARHAARRAAEAAAGFAPARLPWTAPAPAARLRRRGLAAALARRGAPERERTLAWMSHVEPDESGPIDPEPGYETDVALRDEVERVDGGGMLVRFRTATHRFGAEGWERLATTRISARGLARPAEFAASLRIEALAEAWADYREAVAALNRERWQEQRRAREEGAAAAAARADALAAERHTAELLEE